MTAPFHGAKIALICGADLVAWDLPGGGRDLRMRLGDYPDYSAGRANP